MRAFVLAAGFGTRLGSLTRRCPKGMLDIGGRPLLEHIIGNLTHHGFRDIGVNLHFMPELIREQLGDGSRFAARIVYSHESGLLGTAGGVLRMAELLGGGGPLLIHYGDVVTDQNLTALVTAHRERSAAATLLMHRRRASNSVVVLDDEDRITRFLERPSAEERRGVHSEWVNSGVCLCEREVLELFPREQPSDLPAQVFPQLVAGGRFFGLPLSGYRCAVDSAERLQEVRDALATGRYRPAFLRSGTQEYGDTKSTHGTTA